MQLHPQVDARSACCIYWPVFLHLPNELATVQAGSHMAFPPRDYTHPPAGQEGNKHTKKEDKSGEENICMVEGGRT